MAHRSLILSKPDFSAASINRIDGVRPSLFADVRNERYSLNGRRVALNSILAVTAAAGKTFVARDGSLKIAGANTPRVCYRNGKAQLRLEGDATNFITYSNDLSNAVWAKSDFGTGAGIPTVELFSGVAGDKDAVWRVTFPTCVSPQQSSLEHAGGTGVSLIRTGSIEVRADAPCTLALRVQTSESIINITTQWQRFSGQGTAAIQRVLGIKVRPASGTSTSAVVYVRRGQVEDGGLTSYIHNDTIETTRTADICQLTAAAFTVLNGTQGAVVARGTYPITPIASSRLIAYGGFHLAGPRTGTVNQAENFNGTTAVFATASTGTWAGGFGVAAAWDAANRSLVMGGGTVTNDANGRGSQSAIYIGPQTGMQTNQVIELEQLVGWNLPAIATNAQLQAQARY